MQVTTVFYIERDEKEIELYIQGWVIPYTPACLSGHPDNWTPEEGGDSDIEEIFLDEDCTQPWEGKLTAKEKKDAERDLYRAMEDQAQQEPE